MCFSTFSSDIFNIFFLAIIVVFIGYKKIAQMEIHSLRL